MSIKYHFILILKTKCKGRETIIEAIGKSTFSIRIKPLVHGAQAQIKILKAI